MKKIDLTPCSEDCSKWELQVKCNSSKKIGQISIQFCFTKNFYLVDVTSFEGECKMNTEETQEIKTKLKNYVRIISKLFTILVALNIQKRKITAQNAMIVLKQA